MERFYKTASSLAEESQELASELFKHNPSFEGNNGKKSLATLAGMARDLQYKYEDLTNDYEAEISINFNYFTTVEYVIVEGLLFALSDGQLILLPEDPWIFDIVEEEDTL